MIKGLKYVVERDMEDKKPRWLFAYWNGLGRERGGLGIIKVFLVWRSKKTESYKC